MAKFKKGDRVRLMVDQDDSDAGQVGTVLSVSDFPWVEFDTPTRYECTAFGQGREGFCDCIVQRDLQLLPDPEKEKEALLLALEQAVARVEIANAEGDHILSAWLPEAKAAIAAARGAT